MHFVEVLHALSARVVGTALPKAKETSLLMAFARQAPDILNDDSSPGQAGGILPSRSSGALGAVLSGFASVTHRAASMTGIAVLAPQFGGVGAPSRKKPRLTAGHYHAALHVQAAVRGFLARKDESSIPKVLCFLCVTECLYPGRRRGFFFFFNDSTA